jgi:hypothetical protein
VFLIARLLQRRVWNNTIRRNQEERSNTILPFSVSETGHLPIFPYAPRAIIVYIAPHVADISEMRECQP